MGRLIAFAMLAALAGCSPAPRPAVVSDADGRERLAAADALVRAGCLDCLVEAFDAYQALRAVAAVAARATDRAARTAVLVALRERELGMMPGGYLGRARDIAATDTALAGAMTPLVDAADTISPRTPDGRPISDDVQFERRRAALAHREAWLERLQARRGDDPLSAYLWLSFNCTYGLATREAVDRWRADLDAWRDVALVRFRIATCGAVEAAPLDALVRDQPRFVEAHYDLAAAALAERSDRRAMEHLEQAYAWRPRWPTATTALAVLHLTAEEFEEAVELFDRTLDMVPGDPDALRGRVRALTYAGRYLDALADADALLAGRWHVSDARYWRAYNEAELDRLDEAWADIEEAARLTTSAEVPKLAGIIAYRRKQVELARTKFEAARRRDARDCEIGFYLGVVSAELRAWTRTADVLVETGDCLEAEARSLVADIERIKGSDHPPARQQHLIARREQQIAEDRRRLATSWFNVAVAYFNLSRRDDAREYAERVAGDQQFGDRARELLSRLP